MIFIFLILGLFVGSFLNVLVCRIHKKEDFVFDRSRCPHCKKTICWYDNIPVISFIFLKGNCRDCHKKISWQYPLVEIFTGLIFALIGWKFFAWDSFETWLPTFYYLFISGSLIVILVYDWLYLEIPASLLWFSVMISLIFGLGADWSLWGSLTDINKNVLVSDIFDLRVYSGIFAAFLSFIFFYSLSYFSRERWMGMGDAYLVILLGLVLGWPEIILALFLSFSIGAIYGLVMMIFKKKKMKSQIPFAPFLIVGTWIALFFYPPIANWYLSLFFF